MKRPLTILAIVLITTVGLPQPAAAETNVTVGAGGIFPAGTTFNGVPLNGLQSGYGVGLGASGSALGQFCTILIGLNALGGEQDIVIVGKATSGSQTAGNIATFSGSCTINMGDGTAPLVGVPFTATITTNANSQGTIGLLLGLTTLPSATVTQGSMTIQ